MPSLLQTFYDNHLHFFIDGFFWIDIAVVCLVVFLIYYSIIRRSKSIVKKNTIYNTELLRFRTEVYHFYEKNFFI